MSTKRVLFYCRKSVFLLSNDNSTHVIELSVKKFYMPTSQSPDYEMSVDLWSDTIAVV